VSDWRADPAWPAVDVVMPIRNEAAHLAEALAAIRAQNYPGELRILMAVGPSDDGTEAVAAQLSSADDTVTVIDNPVGTTPRALNLAIQAGTAPVVVRVDGHSQLSNGYIEQAVSTLRRTGASNVGGMQVPAPTTPFEHAVAAATTSWLGTGGASYRTGGTEGPVDTVYLGVFDRSAIEAVGLFDEHLIRNQDYELNIRLRQAGGTVVFDPELSVGYTPRGSWSALWRQYYEYGQWKAEVLRMHPQSLKTRQLIPPLAVAVVMVSFVSGLRRPLTMMPALAYSALVLVAGTTAAPRPTLGLRTAAAMATIQFSWSFGLVRGASQRGIAE
jgi:succinoglycan biosynthesis protein ExoA